MLGCLYMNDMTSMLPAAIPQRRSVTAQLVAVLGDAGAHLDKVAFTLPRSCTAITSLHSMTFSGHLLLQQLLQLLQLLNTWPS